MYEILGAGNEGWCVFHIFVSVLTLVLLIVMWTDVKYKWLGGWSGFENMPDYGIGQRGDVIAAVPAYEEESMRQKVDRWVKGSATSQLTGSRDVPVFFQDYDVEATRGSGRTAVSTSREGFEGGKGEEELERALSGRN